jgi:large subunit ribosomal protein L6
MSRIGKVPVTVPAGVQVTLADRTIKVKGAKGELSYAYSKLVEVSQEGDKIIIKRNGDDKEPRAFHGLTRALINNMVVGVSKGFEKRLQLVGVGFRAQVTGKKLTLNVGFSHPIEYMIPDGVKVEMDKEDKNILVVSGIDRQMVGESAAQIRKFRTPEPYKGKGIRYVDEYVRRKAGKAAAKAAA